MQPFFLRTKGEAIRALQTELKNENSNLSKYPADFILFELGEFDESSATITTVAPINIGVLLEFKDQ